MLVEHPTPQLVAITGSVRAGMQVAASAAQSLKRVHLELGGKAPALVFADADLDRAARGIVEAAFFNAGQNCSAGSRILVHSSIKDDFVAALAVEADKRTVGDPTDESTVIGALILGNLSNGMNLLGIGTVYQFIVEGAVLVVAVVLDLTLKGNGLRIKKLRRSN